MKRVRVIMLVGIICLVAQSEVKAQNKNLGEVGKIPIPSLCLEVGFGNMNNIIFPFDIKSIVWGSSDILVQKATGVENILQVRASKKGFMQTNLSVVTADGEFYSLVLNYVEYPSELNFYVFKDSSGKEVLAKLKDAPFNEDWLNNTAKEVLNQKGFLGNKVKEQKMRLKLDGIFLKENTMWFKIGVKNNSLIDFNPEFVKFYVKDKRKAKRTAVQEKEIVPVVTYPCPVIKGKTNETFTLPFSPFTIPKNQELIIQVNEEAGGRSLLLKVRYAVLLKAKYLKGS